MEHLAQLIKLQDYISRYEWNPFRYPSQFIRLKQENWKKLTVEWEQIVEEPEEEEASPKSSRFSKWKRWKQKPRVDVTGERDHTESLPPTKEELKHYFLNRLMEIQMKWATSTITDISYINQKYSYDPEIKYFLQRFPDTYLIMYYPIFNIKKAPIEGEIIVITPINIEIIYLMDEGKDAMIIASDERTWTVDVQDKRYKIINPHIALKRTEQIIKSVLAFHDLEFPIKKTVLSKTNEILYTDEPFYTQLVGRKQYEEWFLTMRSLSSPLKNQQLRVADALLKHCQTSSVKRLEWDEETYAFGFTEENN
ncbi:MULTISPECIES: hypothetical protein [Virgibacillus]|uniref:NERD domain-containing protein n=2 Tax=Virgibacillus TaxID=84406 RepID=A0A024QAL4_9BACI|nr:MULTISPECIES: hypothetical protein [Virgibacillus]EQB35663.1 hypothetical protein M948_11510 [Virgibacillus sp. CM-4]GGJ50652.1 hypothetical protein GCM10007111_11200 [Virgibacillus kapii]CDQ39270.1 hypothetical protein BN990_01564 [Virgibacillus massiliensis]